MDSDLISQASLPNDSESSNSFIVSRISSSIGGKRARSRLAVISVDQIAYKR